MMSEAIVFSDRSGADRKISADRLAADRVTADRVAAEGLVHARDVTAAPFKPFIEEHARRIAEALKLTATPDATPQVPPVDMYDRLNLQLPHLPDAIFPFALDTAPAQPTQNGSLMWPCADQEMKLDWCVFVMNAGRFRPRYEFRCCIRRGLTQAAFLRQVFEAALLLPGDGPEAASYLAQLDAGSISRRTVFMALLDSAAYQAQQIKLLIIPITGTGFGYVAPPVVADAHVAAA